MITHIHNYTTQDGNEFRVEIIAFSQRRINSSKKHELRRVIHNLLSDKIPQWDLDTFIRQVTDDNSEFNREILEKGRKISSLRHIGIKKTKLVSSLKSTATVQSSDVDETIDETASNIEPDEDQQNAG